MAVNGAHSIFRLTTGLAVNEDQTPDKIEFDGTATSPDSKGHINRVRIPATITDTENPNPGSQNSANSQDTGKPPLIIEFHGFFDETAGRSDGIALLRDWWREAKKIKTLYPKGRFGIRSDSRPEFNLTPTSTTGYLLVSVEIDDRVGISKPDFIIRLKHDGDVQSLGV